MVPSASLGRHDLLIAGSLISGSRTPPFLLVDLALTQSLSGPAVASPMKAPTRMAKFMKPMLWLLKLYGGAAKF